jgi:hypothetical protein
MYFSYRLEVVRGRLKINREFVITDSSQSKNCADFRRVNNIDLDTIFNDALYKQIVHPGRELQIQKNLPNKEPSKELFAFFN